MKLTCSGIIYEQRKSSAQRKSQSPFRSPNGNGGTGRPGPSRNGWRDRLYVILAAATSVRSHYYKWGQ